MTLHPSQCNDLQVSMRRKYAFLKIVQWTAWTVDVKYEHIMRSSTDFRMITLKPFVIVPLLGSRLSTLSSLKARSWWVHDIKSWHSLTGWVTYKVKEKKKWGSWFQLYDNPCNMTMVTTVIIVVLKSILHLFFSLLLLFAGDVSYISGVNSVLFSLRCYCWFHRFPLVFVLFSSCLNNYQNHVKMKQNSIKHLQPVSSIRKESLILPLNFWKWASVIVSYANYLRKASHLGSVL